MNRGRMDLHVLEILLAFKKYGTLSSTAEALHISQPTLTRNMQALEKEVDVPIFITIRIFSSPFSSNHAIIITHYTRDFYC